MVCLEGNFGVQLKVALVTGGPLNQGIHDVALLCAPCYRVPLQYLYRAWYYVYVYYMTAVRTL